MAASKPTSSLSSAIYHLLITLSQHLGTLTVVWVFSLSGAKFSPGSPFPNVYSALTFGVGQETDTFRCLSPQSVALPLKQPRLRLDCGLLRQEPAITRLDGLFTPIPRLPEHMHVEPVLASTRFYPCFTIPRNRSSGFGSNPSNSRHFHTPPLALAGCGHFAFATAAPIKD